LLGTFPALPGMSKYNINARLDLEDTGIRKDLHLKRDGDSYMVPMPHIQWIKIKR
jgi:hypothetical protein